MSMITGCPACGTLFRVVPDQLRISEGWVRCGHCSEVFDARAHLQEDWEEPAAAPSATTAPTPLPAPAPAPVSELQPWVEPETRPRPVVIAAEGPRAEQAVAQATPATAPAARADVDDGPGYTLDFVREAVDPMPDPEPDPVPAAAAPATAKASRLDDEPIDADVDDVSFVREARRKAFWRRPLVRTVLSLVILGLLGVLALQVAVQERDRLAAWQPQVRPLLLQLCEPLGCTVQPPQRIDAILIDSSGFTRLRPETYRLSFTLRNQSALPVAVPALELTLTDIQDQPVLRRVLTPAELRAPEPTLGPGADWSASVAVAVNPNGSTGRIAGYRLLAFYP